MKKQRLDEWLIENGTAADARDAFVIVTEGRVFVDGQKAVSPAQPVSGASRIEVRAGREFVGRGAYKLEAAMKEFAIAVDGLTCADVGSATGGFVEVLLKHGATKVYAIDTARGKLDPKLREDRRVVVMEGANALSIEKLPELISLITIDVSLTSIRVVLPRIRGWLGSDGHAIALLKPQYEAEARDLTHGIVKSDAAREEIVEDFRSWLSKNGWHEKGMIESPIRGSEGNVEYLFWLGRV